MMYKNQSFNNVYIWCILLEHIKRWLAAKLKNMAFSFCKQMFYNFNTEY